MIEGQTESNLQSIRKIPEKVRQGKMAIKSALGKGASPREILKSLAKEGIKGVERMDVLRLSDADVQKIIQEVPSLDIHAPGHRNHLEENDLFDDEPTQIDISGRNAYRKYTRSYSVKTGEGVDQRTNVRFWYGPRIYAMASHPVKNLIIQALTQ